MQHLLPVVSLLTFWQSLLLSLEQLFTDEFV